MHDYNEIIKKICELENIKLTSYQEGSWLKILEKNNKTRYIVGYKFSLNNQGISNIMDDKGLFHDLLNYKKIPVIVHHVIFNKYDKEEILNLFNKYNKKVIIKGNIGTCGREVYKVEDENRLFEIIDMLLINQYSISLCPYYDIENEYRVIVLNNEIKLIYGKENAKVVGDGIHSLQELAINFNERFFTKHPTKDYLPKKDELVIIDYRFNLSNGARVIKNIDKDLEERIIDLANKVVKETNPTFASIDIIKTIDNNLLVMEANSGIMMYNYLRQTNDYDKVFNIYHEAIKLMFKED